MKLHNMHQLFCSYLVGWAQNNEPEKPKLRFYSANDIISDSVSGIFNNVHFFVEHFQDLY